MSKDAINRAIGFFEAERNKASYDVADHFSTAIDAMEILLAEMDNEKASAEIAVSNRSTLK